MGRTRKRFNEKARRSLNNEVCRDEKEKVVVDIKIQEEKYDSSNPLVICGKKKVAPKEPLKELPTVMPLCRKQKKKLANILAKKKKKLNRSELLEKLNKVQAKPKDLNSLTSTAFMQTHGVKRFIQENSAENHGTCSKISNIKGSRKKNALLQKKKLKLDVVSFEISSSDSDGEESESEVKDGCVMNAINTDYNCAQETSVDDCINSTEEIKRSSADNSIGNMDKRDFSTGEMLDLEEIDNQDNPILFADESNQLPENFETPNQPLETQMKITDVTEIQEEKCGSSDPLITSKRKKYKLKKLKELLATKHLSKKQRKKLENILAKEKKLRREELLEKLSKVQAVPEDLNSLTSTASVHTHGVKKLIEENYELKINRIKGEKKKNTIRKELKSDDSSENLECNLSGADDGEVKGEDKEEGECSTVSNIQEKCIVSSSISIDKNEGSQDGNIHNVKNTEQKNVSKNNEHSNSVDDKSDRVPAVFVPLNRLPEVQVTREALPIFCEEQSIMEAIRENSVVVIHGETGSGKTTQVPQFLYEGGYTQNNKRIGITEPRRIAAMTMAARVGKEMNLPEVVGYHVRYDNTIKKETQIKFMTDGILLKEIRHDFYLTKYSVIIIDEAHERSVFSDVLIGLLSRIVPLREKGGDPLKLIIMSATMRVQDFLENPRLFKEPPFLIRLDSRQYKVQVHFNIRTPSDYVEAAYQKVCKIHTQLPAGAILVFLTGEKEVTKLCKMLRNTYPFKDDKNYVSENTKLGDPVPDTINKSKAKKRRKENDASFCSLPDKINLDDYSVEPLDAENMQHEFSDEDDDSATNLCNVSKQDDFTPLYTLPFYSVLPFQEQEKVFQPPPLGSRLCVVSTNVAETSITIPGLKYVVDTGKVKTRIYNAFAGGISQFCIEWTSKASANQRAGRAGRTEGGHCYRLYSSSVFEHEFLDFSLPEIQRIPVDDVLLQMKALGIVRVVNFPFPSPPDHETLKTAEQRLVLLGALEDLNKEERYKSMKKWEYSAKITRLGEAMSRFPLSPRYAKMLILSYKHRCIHYIIAIVSAMTVPEVFLNSTSDASDEVNPEQKLLWKGIKNISAGCGKSLELGDAIVLLRTVALFEDSKNKMQFCMKNGVRHKAMVEIHKMRLQLHREMNRAFKDLSLSPELNIEPPNEEQIEKLRKILTAGFTDHVARLFSEEEMKLNKDLKNAYKCLDLEDPVFIHPSSILFSELPRYIIYQEIVHTSKYYMKGIVEINPEWLPAFAPTMCQFSDPLDEPVPNYDSEKDQILCSMNVTFGPWQWELPAVIKDMPKVLLKYSWFSFFLLDGQVYKFFRNYKKHLLSSPSTLLKSWAKSLPRTRYLLEALYNNKVDSKNSLEKMWGKEPKFLLREYWEWLPYEKHMEVECKWPPKS